MNEPFDFISYSVNDKKNKDYFMAFGVYFFGEIEQEKGDDLCSSSINLLMKEEGIYDVTVDGKEGFLLYLWNFMHGETNINRGIVCKSEDTDACSYAKNCFNLKLQSI